jgi:hypothetical protein
LILQAGAFGEHEFTSVKDRGGVRPLATKWLRVILKPGAVGRLELGMKRYVNPPSYASPWPAR